MKKSVILMSMILGLFLVSCNKGYTHKKEVTNNSDNTIEVISGCCGQTESYSIKPRSTEVVFECFYQGKKPTTDELSWDFVVIEDGEVIDISNSSEWRLHEENNEISYTYIFK